VSHDLCSTRTPGEIDNSLASKFKLPSLSCDQNFTHTLIGSAHSADELVKIQVTRVKYNQYTFVLDAD
jgi:hypothetical protein